MDSGTAYGRPRPSYDATPVKVEPGTPAGELLRRYWHPISVAAEIHGSAPEGPRARRGPPLEPGLNAGAPRLN